MPASSAFSHLRMLIAVCVLALLAACGGADLEAEIVGTWQELDGPETIEFDADGGVLLHYEGMALEGSYEFIARDRVLLDLRGPRVTSDPIEAPVGIDDDILMFTMPDGRVARYGRAD